MNKYAIRTALVAAAAVPMSILTSLPAHAAPAAPAAAQVHTASTGTHRPFRIKAGKIYDVTSRVSGVRHGDRLALESRYGKRWHKIGSWAMHAGERNFRGAARTSHPGLYTLRVQFQRHGHLLAGSASNTFEVDVLRFHTPGAHRSGNRPSGLGATGLHLPSTERGGVLSGWTSPQCGVGNDGGTIGLGTELYVPAPISRLTGTGEVNQVLWVRDALPGGSYGAWYVAANDEQYIHPATDSNILVITGAGDIKDSSYLDDLYVNYEPQDEYHQIAWNLEAQNSDGTWSWASSSDYEPGAYQQWNQRGDSYSQSAYCLTYRNGGQ